MYQRLSTTSVEPSLDRALNIDIVRRFFSGRLRETQEFILSHLEKSSAKRHARAKQRQMSPRDQDLNLRLELAKAKAKHQGII